MNELSGINKSNEQPLYNETTNKTATWQGRIVQVVQEFHHAIYLSLIKLAVYCHLMNHHKHQPVKEVVSETQSETNIETTKNIDSAMVSHLKQAKRLNYMVTFRAKQMIALLKHDLSIMIRLIEEQSFTEEDKKTHKAIFESLHNSLERLDDRLEQDNPLRATELFEQMQKLLKKMTQSREEINNSKNAFQKNSAKRHLFWSLGCQFLGRVKAIKHMFTSQSTDTFLSYIQHDERQTFHALKKVLQEDLES